MGDALSFGLLAMSAMFVIVDPIGMVPLFLSLTPGYSAERRAQTAKRACLVAWGILTAFALGGTVLFNLLGVTLSAFKIAGGFLLFLTALDQLRAERQRTKTAAEEEEEGTHKDDVSIVPMAIPLLAGPGSIATSTVLVSRAQSPTQVALVLVAISLTLALTFVTLRLAHPLSKYLGKTGMLVTSRLIGLVLAAIGVQFMLDGVLEAIRQ